MRGKLDIRLLVRAVDAADGDVLPRGHLVAHEVLEDDADLAMEIFELVVAEVHAVEQDLPFGRVVETRDQLDDGGLALAVLADQCDALPGRKCKGEVASTRCGWCPDR